MKFIEEFKSFAMRGNVIDLAVGVIIGAAFGKIVTSVVNDMLMPFIGFVTGKVDISALKFVIIEKTATSQELAIKYGAFLQSVIDFLLIVLAIFAFIKFVNKFNKKKEEAEEAPGEAPKQEVLLEEIRDLLKDKKGV